MGEEGGAMRTFVIDDALVVALGHGGASFVAIGMMKELFTVSKLTCTEDKKARTYRCIADPSVDPPDQKPFTLTGDDARAVVLNLVQRKIAPQTSGDRVTYAWTFQCRQYDGTDQGSDVSCH
jgi:hypothetical protein